MIQENISRKLAAILSTDVKGYSRLMGDDEMATVETITRYRTVISKLVETHSGRVVDSPGDNLLAEFYSAVNALECAAAIQEGLKDLNSALPDHRKMEFRIGINVGDVIAQGDRIYGDGVNIAARLESLSDAGGICISGTVYDQVKNKLPYGYAFMGDQRVKNISDPVRAYKVILNPDNISAETPTRILSAPEAGSAENAAKSVTDLVLPDKPSIAVLPLLNLSRNPEEEYFSDGLTEDIITDLSKVSGLFVIARNSAFAYKGRAVQPPQVARELGVRNILEGSVRRAGDRIRVSTQLVDGLTNHNVWAERYDGRMEDIFDLQDQVTQQVVDALRVKLTDGEQALLDRHTSVNPEAYDLTKKANKLGLISTPEAHLEARRMYEKALRIDPRYPPALVGLGWTVFDEWPFGWSEDMGVLEEAKIYAENAISLDKDLPDAYLLLSCALTWQRRHDEALDAIRKCLKIAPSNADALSFLGYIKNFMGRPQEALKPIKEAIRLDPGAPVRYWSYLATAYSLLGRWEAAAAELEKALEKSPDYLPARNSLVRVYVELGDMESAVRIARSIKADFPGYDHRQIGFKLPFKDADAAERYRTASEKAFSLIENDPAPL